MSTAAPIWTPADYQERTGKLLLPQHHEQLVASAISLDVAAARGYWSATRRSELNDLGFGTGQQKVIRDPSRSENPAAALVVPLWWLAAEPVLHQVRPDAPRCDNRGKPVKYETPRSAGGHLDVHPSMREALAAPDLPLVITEGIKKGDAATTAGLCCIALLGVDSWRGRNEQGGLTALGEWNDVHLKGRRVYLCFDSDVMAKTSVYMALLKLRSYLESKGADIFVIYLPSGDGGAKVGLDDFLAAGTARDDLLALGTKDVRHPDQTKEGAETWEIGDYLYSPNGIWLRARRENAPDRLLADFNAHIERKDVEDDGEFDRERDGQELLDRQRFHLVIQQGRRTVRHSVSAAGFHAMRWPAEVAHLDLIVSATGTRETLREAIEIVSGEVARKRGHEQIPRRTVFVHTGWRFVNGRFVYLHAGGGIDPDGAVEDVEVRLEAQLRDFALPDPLEGTDLIAAVRASLSLLELGPDEVMVPSLGAVYRAPLAPADFSLHSTGNSDRFKSEVAALLQQHFGDAWHGKNLPLSWMSTGNAAEGVLHQAKEAFAVVDDFLPSGLPRAEREKMLQTAARIFRAQGNRTGRSRMRADTSLRAPKEPRGLLFSTGEELPPGLSQLARVWIISHDKDVITSDRLTAYQRQTSLYGEAMAGYLRWLAPQIKGMAAHLRSRVEELRGSYRAAHRRTSDTAANLEIGWDHFLSFALECGAITAAERADYQARVRAALLEGASAQADYQRDVNPVEKYLRGIKAALAAGAVHVSGPHGTLPEHPASWGWRPRTVGTGQYEEERWEPRGDRIGWVADESLYVLPEAAYKAASAMHSDGLGIGESALRLALRDSGLLIKAGEGKHIAVRAPRSIDRLQPRVLRMRADLTPGSPQPPRPLGGNGVHDGRGDPTCTPSDPTWGPPGGITLGPVRAAVPSSKSGNERPNQSADPTDPTDPTAKQEREIESEHTQGSDDEWEVGEV